MAFAGTGNALFPAYVRLLLQSRRLPGLDPGVGRRHHSRGFADAVVQHLIPARSAAVNDQLDSPSVAQRQAAKSIPLGFVLPLAADRYLLDKLRLHRLAPWTRWF